MKMQNNNNMGRKSRRTVGMIALLLSALTLLPVFTSCGAPAPAGMYAPEDADEYINGLERAIFSVPEDYVVTMSSNMLAAKKEKSSFSLQCRLSDYHYDSLYRNYSELRAELVGLFGDYTETLTEGLTVAGQEALEARYTLTVGGERFDYVQELFYSDNNRFFLFTYCEPQGGINEELLRAVLDTVSLKLEGYAAPQGYIAVENAAAREITFDRYELYCPDKWILDTSTGEICMRIPSSEIVSSVLFHEIPTGDDFNKYTADYAARVAPQLDMKNEKGLRAYIASSVWQLKTETTDLKLYSAEGGEAALDIARSELAGRCGEYIGSYTSGEGLNFSYVEYSTSVSTFNAHGNKQPAAEPDEAEADLTEYRVRQYFICKNGYLYLFTYLSTENHFEEHLEDAVKVVKNFVLK